MNISVLTVYDAPNCGSFLQAYATKRILEKRGHRVYYIKYRNGFDRIKLIFANEKRNLLHPIFSLIKGYKYLDIQKKQFDLITIGEAQAKCDKNIIGSDELWNIRNDKYFSKEIFYGKGFKKDDVLVFAISCNESAIDDFSDNIIECIKELKFLTYRDVHTGNIVNLINSEARYCCDPTLIVDLNELQLKYNGILPDKYIVIYAYTVSYSHKKLICEFAHKNNLKIVSLCNAFFWADYNIVCSPLEFSYIIKSASYIVSTTFHGCVFSILNNKKVICLKRTPKIADLLERFLMEDVIYLENNINEFTKILSQNRDWERINQIVDENRIIGNKVIDNFLNSKGNENLNDNL